MTLNQYKISWAANSKCALTNQSDALARLAAISLNLKDVTTMQFSFSSITKALGTGGILLALATSASAVQYTVTKIESNAQVPATFQPVTPSDAIPDFDVTKMKDYTEGQRGASGQYGPLFRLKKEDRNAQGQVVGNYYHKQFVSFPQAFITEANGANPVAVDTLTFTNFVIPRSVVSHREPFFVYATNINDAGQFLVSLPDGVTVVNGRPSPAWHQYLISPDTSAPTQEPYLASGKELTLGQSITSPNGQYVLRLGADGNLVQYKNGTPVWQTATAQKAVVRAQMQADGNFVLYDAKNQPAFVSYTYGYFGSTLNLQDDGDLVISAANGLPAKSIK
jgi:hypothetical protein